MAQLKKTISHKILLVDVDSQIPNLALMKIAAWHKRLGHDVFFIQLGISYFPTRKKPLQNVCTDDYKTVYVSAIFPGSVKMFRLSGACRDIYTGGTGLDLRVKLPSEVEKMLPDYNLYPDNDISYGFLTRGCSRRCSFCLVHKKEGDIRLDTALEDIVRHKKVKFLDNNILMHPKHMRLLRQIKDANIRCQFNQGLDIRLVTDENAQVLNSLTYLGEYIFAFDRISEEKKISKGLALFQRYVTAPWRTKFFVYCHPDMDILSDVVYRCEWLRKREALPYLMRDISCWESEASDFYVDYCAYVNQPNLFKKMSFEEYMVKRQPKNIKRRDKSLKLYRGCRGA